MPENDIKIDLVLNNQNTLPAFMFYPNDYTGDSALMSCSLEAIGVWNILLCRMHNAPIYGTLTQENLLKQKDKQNENIAPVLPLSFAKICRIVGRGEDVVLPLLHELMESGVLKFDETSQIYFCKRMVKDHYLRQIRRAAGSAGGTKKKENDAKKFAKAKVQAKRKQIPVNENEYEYEYVNTNKTKVEDEPKKEKTVFGQVMDLYFAFFEKETGIKPKISPRDGKALNELIAFFTSTAKHVQGDLPETEMKKFITDCMKVIFDGWNLQEDFIKKQVDLYQISSNINKIVFRLKSLKNERNNGTNAVTGSGKQSPGNITDQQIFASIAAKFG